MRVFRILVAACVAVALTACGDDKKQTADDIVNDTSDIHDAVDGDVGDDMPPTPVDRTMISDSPPRLPSDNRIHLPEFRPVWPTSWGSATDESLVHGALPETPYRLSYAQLPDQSDAGFYQLGMAGDGVHSASVWIGLDAPDGNSATLMATPVSVLGITIGDATTTPVAVDLQPQPDSLVERDGRVWLEFATPFMARTGPFVLVVQGANTRVHAPYVQLTTPDPNGLLPAPATPRVSTTRERQILSVWQSRTTRLRMGGAR